MSSKLFLTGAILAATALPATAQMIIPTNADPTNCTITEGELTAWFTDQTIAPGGAVWGADSVDFPTDNTVCEFYKWGAQMFLWLSSPTDDGLTLNSPAIFNVLPEIAGTRELQPNVAGAPLLLAHRAEKTDALAAGQSTTDEIEELGQAGGSAALISQMGANGQNSLVYYGVHVNDAYAYFLSGQKNDQLAQTVFPRNSTDLDDIVAYMANAYPYATLHSPQTLVMELKSSWIEADTLDDSSGYITVDALVPDIDHSGALPWAVPTDAYVPKTLALTGLHIVGTVQNHPEFVWITYEHIENAPDDTYFYTDTGGNPVEQAYDASGSYTFMATGGTTADALKQCLVADAPADSSQTTSIAATGNCADGVSVDNVYRKYPWGSVANSQNDFSLSAKEKAQILDNNTQLIALNHALLGLLPASDPRANYALTAGIWTNAPSATADAPIPSDTSTGYADDTLRGSLYAFNATMETYTQGTSCFSCHNQPDKAANSFGDNDLSHIYFPIDKMVPATD